MLHIDSSGNNETSRWWFDSATQRGVTFDVIGLSCYLQCQGSLSEPAAPRATGRHHCAGACSFFFKQSDVNAMLA